MLWRRQQGEDRQREVGATEDKDEVGEVLEVMPEEADSPATTSTTQSLDVSDVGTIIIKTNAQKCPQIVSAPTVIRRATWTRSV